MVGVVAGGGGGSGVLGVGVGGVGGGGGGGGCRGLCCFRQHTAVRRPPRPRLPRNKNREPHHRQVEDTVPDAEIQTPKKSFHNGKNALCSEKIFSLTTLPSACNTAIDVSDEDTVNFNL